MGKISATILSFHCPHCNQHIEAEPGYAGKDLNCPTCSQSFTIPAARNRRFLPWAIGIVFVAGAAGVFINYHSQKVPGVALAQPPVPAEKSDTAAADSDPPITGAFGWTLGQKIPAEIPLQTDANGSRYQYQTSTNPPFESILVSCTDDRTIFGISGFTSATKKGAEYHDLTTALRQKYGVSDGEWKADSEKWERPGAQRSITIVVTGQGDEKYVIVHYMDFKLTELADREAEQRQISRVKSLADKL
jgi:hypothetical protein